MDSGEYCAIWLGPEMPGDQRADDAKSVCFDSSPLQASIDIVGAPVVRLKLAADRPTAMVAVRLCDVHPDGASTRIELRMTYTGELDALGQRVVGGREIAWVQRVEVDTAACTGVLSVAHERGRFEGRRLTPAHQQRRGGSRWPTVPTS